MTYKPVLLSFDLFLVDELLSREVAVFLSEGTGVERGNSGEGEDPLSLSSVVGGGLHPPDYKTFSRNEHIAKLARTILQQFSITQTYHYMMYYTPNPTLDNGHQE